MCLWLSAVIGTEGGWKCEILSFCFRVKFGVHLDEVCKNDIPAPLLVLILKLNKEAPFKKDVFRAPGYQVCCVPSLKKCLQICVVCVVSSK